MQAPPLYRERCGEILDGSHPSHAAILEARRTYGRTPQPEMFKDGPVVFFQGAYQPRAKLPPVVPDPAGGDTWVLASAVGPEKKEKKKKRTMPYTIKPAVARKTRAQQEQMSLSKK